MKTHTRLLNASSYAHVGVLFLSFVPSEGKARRQRNTVGKSTFRQETSGLDMRLHVLDNMVKS